MKAASKNCFSPYDVPCKQENSFRSKSSPKSEDDESDSFLFSFLLERGDLLMDLGISFCNGSLGIGTIGRDYSILRTGVLFLCLMKMCLSSSERFLPFSVLLIFSSLATSMMACTNSFSHISFVFVCCYSRSNTLPYALTNKECSLHYLMN